MGLQSYYEDSFREEKSRSVSDLMSEELIATKALAKFVLEQKDRFLPDKP